MLLEDFKKLPKEEQDRLIAEYDIKIYRDADYNTETYIGIERI